MKFKVNTPFLACVLLLSFNNPLKIYSQDSTEAIKTDVFWLNLCTPKVLTSVIKPKTGRNRYEANWKNNISFGLTNINQFRYDYTINSIPFAAFVDSTYGGFSNSIAASIDLTSNPYFNFVVKVKSPNKENFKKLQAALDSTIKSYNNTKKEIKKIQAQFDTEADLKKNTDAFKKYRDLNNGAEDLSEMIYSLQDKINKFSYDQQYNALRTNFLKLKPVEIFLFDTITAVNTITTESYNKDNTSKQFVTANYFKYDLSFNGAKPDYAVYIPQLLSFFQQNAEYIRTIFSQFEVIYEREKNYLISSQCKDYSKQKKRYLDSLVNIFIKAKNVFVELNDIYAISPLQDDYLEDYLLTESQYSNKLFGQYMGLSKIMNVDTTYITPTSSNMKNFDLIRIELEKTDKTSNKTEKYDYDIFLKGGLKIDFSAGIFGSFLKNEEYNSIDSLNNNNQPTDKKMIKPKDLGRVNIGFGGMVNVSIRTGESWLTPGISFGFILDTKPSLQFLSSFTIGMGKSERLLIHAGYAMGFVKRIDGLPLNQNIPTITIGNTIPTTDKFLARPFFGITYNLSKNNVFKITSFTTSTSSNTMTNDK